MNWIESHGHRPNTRDRLLNLKFRNGEQSRFPYLASRIRWTDTGDDWDVVAYARAAE